MPNDCCQHINGDCCQHINGDCCQHINSDCCRNFHSPLIIVFHPLLQCLLAHVVLFPVTEFCTGATMAVGTDDGVRQVRRTHDRPCDDPPGDHLGCRTHVLLVQ